LPIADSRYHEPGTGTPADKTNRFLYQGKEWQTSLALNLYDFHARQYDPATGRFTGVDPKADIMPYMGTYAGMMNNPTFYTDPDGECPICVIMLVGAIVNVGIQAASGNINSFGDFASFFVAGAVGGLGYAVGGPMLGGALLGAGNGLASGGGWKGALIGAGIGAIAGGVFQAAGPLADKAVQGIAGPVLSKGLQIGIQGGLAGFAAGTSGGLFTGQSLGESLKMGAKGAGIGFGLGFVGGGISGYVQARNAGFNPWTGQRVSGGTSLDQMTAKGAPSLGDQKPVAPSELPKPTTTISSNHSTLQGTTLQRGDFAGKGLHSKVLTTSFKQLQSKFKHASDFGVNGNFNKSNAINFNSKINQHINSPGVQAIQGTYRGQQVIHFVNPSTGLNIISTPTGQFISGWQLNQSQLWNVLNRGSL